MSEINVQKENNNQISQKSNSFLLDGENVIGMFSTVFDNKENKSAAKSQLRREYNRIGSDTPPMPGQRHIQYAYAKKQNAFLIVTDKRLVISKSPNNFDANNKILSMPYESEAAKLELQMISINNALAMEKLKYSDTKNFLKGRLHGLMTNGFSLGPARIKEIDTSGMIKGKLEVSYSSIDLLPIENKYHLKIGSDEDNLPKLKTLPNMPPNATKSQIKERAKEEKKLKKDEKLLNKYRSLLRKGKGDTAIRRYNEKMIEKNKLDVRMTTMIFEMSKDSAQKFMEVFGKKINEATKYFVDAKQIEQDYMAPRLKRN
jgi:hypothetical protein